MSNKRERENNKKNQYKLKQQSKIDWNLMYKTILQEPRVQYNKQSRDNGVVLISNPVHKETFTTTQVRHRSEHCIPFKDISLLMKTKRNVKK